jgi:hypothetical protein
MRSEGIAPPTLNVGTRWISVIKFTPALPMSLQEKEPPVPVGQEAGWTQPTLTLCSCQYSNRPACDLVTILTELPWLIKVKVKKVKLSRCLTN